MARLLVRMLGATLGCVFVAHSTAAQWSDDPAQNLVVADRVNNETLPLVASTSDGGVYITWFDASTGSFRVYLQRLDAAGGEQWAHNGVLISAHPQNSALFGWDMIADSADNAVIVFSDQRDGGDLDIHAYKVDPAGNQLWGADGITLSSNPDFEPAPRVAEASDGDLVFVWQRDPSVGDADIRMQRLSPAGVLRLAAGGVAVVTSAGEDPGFVDLVAAEDGNVILSWLRNIRTFASPRHVRALEFSPTGAPVWASWVEVYNAFSVPIGYFPQVHADGSGGAFLLWHRSDGTFFNSFVQHLDSAGAELWPHNGVAVSTTANMHHIDPTLSLDVATGDTLVFWSEQVSNQSQRGIFAQKLSPAGARQWGAGGLQLLPVDMVFKSFPRSVPLADGAIVFLVDRPSGTDRLIAMRIDAAGTQVWGTPAVVSSATSNKARYPVTIGPDDVGKVVWEDDRSGAVDIYAQNVNADGTLGVPPIPGSVEASLLVDKSSVTPGDLRLEWGASCALGAVDYAIYEGVLGDFTSHVRKDCSDNGGDRTEEVHPSGGNRYYLVVPLSATDEGSYGQDSDGNELPPATAGQPCLATQLVTDCTP